MHSAWNRRILQILVAFILVFSSVVLAAPAPVGSQAVQTGCWQSLHPDLPPDMPQNEVTTNTLWIIGSLCCLGVAGAALVGGVVFLMIRKKK
jgi:hypothetical protein